MYNLLDRINNETKYEYIKRLVCGKLIDRTINADYEELSEKIFGEGNCYNSSEVRKRMYGIKHIIEIIDKEKVINISDDNILQELETKKRELQKEKIKVQTEKAVLSQLLRESARFELFTERAIQAIKEIQPLPSPIKIINNKNKIEGLLCISDAHFGKEILIKGLKGEIINEYNEDIFKQRMYKLLDKTIEICKKENLIEIHIMNLGDELDGLIHLGQLVNLKYGVVESAIKYAYFIATWLSLLSNNVKIKFYSTCGNHTDLRLLGTKKGELPHENISKVIFVLTKEILKDNPNIECIENETEMIYTQISGFNVLGTHGEEKDVQQSIRDYSYMYNEDISYLVTGHKHHANSINLGVSKGTIGVGSICGLDDFSLKIKKISEASSTFVVFEECVGKTIEYNISLN